MLDADRIIYHVCAFGSNKDGDLCILSVFDSNEGVPIKGLTALEMLELSMRFNEFQKNISEMVQAAR